MSSAVGVPPPQKREVLEKVTVRFAGDSGDGMQLVGNLFATESALMGNDLATFPDYPAEIRAPAGTVAAVSGFQLQIGASEVYTPGDHPDVLVAMNPAALKVGTKDLKDSGVILLNTAAMGERNLQKAGLSLEDIEKIKSRYRVIELDISRLTQKAVEGLGLGKPEAERCKNFYALGLISWMFQRSIDPTLEWMDKKFSKNPQILEANRRAIEAGYHYGENTEVWGMFPLYSVPRAKMATGRYANLTGNQAMALGLVAAAMKAGKELFLGSYPITPASDILHELSRQKHLGVVTFQAEDEIAAIGSAIGASYAGLIGITSTSGPGFDLKQEALGLAVMVELPLVILNVQRAGPSTGLPTKTEQADLLQALYGRHGEAPVIVLAPQSPGDCFYIAYEAVRLAVTKMTPVVVLSDGYLANGSEPFRIPEFESLAPIEAPFWQGGKEDFLPYRRNPETLVRPWVVPGTPGLEHRVGGLEKDALTGRVSYDADNHEAMMLARKKKVELAVNDIAQAEVLGNPEAQVLLVGWGSTYGAIAQAMEELQQDGIEAAQLHLRHLNPLPKNLGDLLRRHPKVVVPEINLGQLVKILREKYLVPAVSYHRVRGMPLQAKELAAFVKELLQGAVA